MTSHVRAPYRWRRSLVAAATAALVGAPLLAADPAGAAAATSSDPDTVTFTGGCGLLGIGAASRPDPAEITVPVGSRLRFVNALGQRATLWTQGEPAGQVADGGAVDLTFHDGPVAVSMRLSCLLGKPAGEVRVTVTAPAASPSPSPTPGGRAPEDSSGPPESGDDPAGSTDPESAPAAGSGAPGGRGQPGTATAPEGASGSSSGASPDAYSAAGQPVRPDGPMSRPGGPGEVSGGGRDAAGSSVVSDPVTVQPPVVGDSSGWTSTGRSATDNGAVGLLALVATACLVGASAGAIRVLLSRRSNRLNWA